jgi:hypothetical protein
MRDLPRARAAFRESLQLSRRSRDVLVVHFCLLGLAGVAGLGQHYHRAAQLWGSADRLRHVHGLHLGHFVRTAIPCDGAVAEAREQLGEAVFAAAWDEGRTMRLNQAIDYALEETVATPAGGMFPQ